MGSLQPKKGLENCRILAVNCPECPSKQAYFDEDRSEVFCEECGLLLMWNPPYLHGRPALKSAVFGVEMMQASILTNNCIETSFKRNNYSQHIHSLEKKTGRRHGNKKKWRKKQYHRYVKVVHTNIFMTPYQKERAHYIIDHVDDFRKLHGKNNYETLVSAICIYAIEEHNKGIIDYNHPFFKEVNLEECDCKKIFSKIGAIVGKNHTPQYIVRTYGKNIEES